MLKHVDHKKEGKRGNRKKGRERRTFLSCAAPARQKKVEKGKERRKRRNPQSFDRGRRRPRDADFRCTIAVKIGRKKKMKEEGRF